MDNEDLLGRGFDPMIDRRDDLSPMEVCMQRRMNIMLVAILVMLGAIIWIVVQSQNRTIFSAAAPSGASATPALAAQASSAAPASAEHAHTSSPAPLPEAAPMAEAASSAVRTDLTRATKAQLADRSGYAAAKGDTLSNVATGLLGSDSKENRNAVIAANPSLQADPDLVLAGKTYVASPANGASAVPAPHAANVAASQSQAPTAGNSSSDRELKYVAQPGDSVSVLAADLLGGDSKTNRDAIISHNPSLQDDPDRVVVGKTYKIPGKDGLSSAAAPALARTSSPATQPDADGVVVSGAGRELRYTARAGDTVSKLAEILLGSDTQANRDAIINNNASLKNDPDHVVAGQTYWIPAPSAPVE
jgi:hypothetical protein